MRIACRLAARVTVTACTAQQGTAHSKSEWPSRAQEERLAAASPGSLRLTLYLQVPARHCAAVEAVLFAVDELTVVCGPAAQCAFAWR